MKTVKASFIKQPKYYKDFKCIGNECLSNCCHSWQIRFTAKETERLRNSACSDSLKNLIEQAFVPYPNTKDFKIKFTDDNKCPMLDECNLCRVQKELGEYYLSNTCRNYPRRNCLYNSVVIRSCVLSCNYVLSLICSDDSSMELECVKDIKNLDNVTGYKDSDVKKNPALNYVSEIFDFFYEILSDRSRSLETSVVLGAMAAQKLDEYIKKGQHDRIPEIIKALKPLLNNPQQIEKLEAVKPNLSLKVNFSTGLMKKLNGSTIFDPLFENSIPNQEIFDEGMEIFRKQFDGTPEFMRNIALNLYITNRMPYRSNLHSLFENYCYFVAELAVIKCLIPAVAVHYSHTHELIILTISHLDRTFTHNDKNVSKIIEHMKECKLTSPAYLLGIIK